MTPPSVIEHILQHKENIVPLDNGRSASKLSLSLKPPNSHLLHKDRLHDGRALHERLLLDSEESDDPLQLYLDYISWTYNSYTSGPSHDSGLVPLLERCTSTFRDTPLYKNDPRYLSTWLLYSQYSDSPKDIFVYLAKKKIGLTLALYYERFATYLESTGNLEDAKHVYITGIKQEAFPINRLRKSYQLFCARLENRQPPSERLPPTLNQGTITAPSLSHDQPHPKKAKFACHVDTEPTPSSSSIFADPARSPGALADRSTRIKENVMAASTWAGAIIEPRIPLARADSSFKFTVFRDQDSEKPSTIPSGPTYPLENKSISSDIAGRSYTIVNQGNEFVSFVKVQGKRPEKVQINMDLLYNDNLCPLELLSIRKKLQKTCNERLSLKHLHGAEVIEPGQSKQPNLNEISHVQSMSESICRQKADANKLASNLHSSNVQNQSQPAALRPQSFTDSRHSRSPYDHSPQKMNFSLNAHATPSRPILALGIAPTSAHTFSAVSRSLKRKVTMPLSQESPIRSASEKIGSATPIIIGGVTLRPTTSGIDAVSHYPKDRELEAPTANENITPTHHAQHESHNIQEAEILTTSLEPEPLPYHHDGMGSPTITGFSRAANQEVYAIFNCAASEIKSTHDDFKMDDDPTVTNFDGFVTETIRLPPQPLPPAPTPPTDTEAPDCSSPFVELPSTVRAAATVVDPRDPELQDRLLQDLSTPLSSFPGYFDMSRRKIARAAKFQAITDHKTLSISKGSRLAMIDFCGDGLFCLRHQLGKGGYGTVYLTELESCGSLGALKIESPAARWEFYILRQIHNRLQSLHARIQSLFVVPHSLYFFQDESYLFMDYCSQGNLLDLVNMYKSNGKLVDEALCVHLTIELLKATQVLHQNGLVHGDLKADNCMLRFELCLLNDHYSVDPDSPWQRKSITLIDFGKSIDLNLFKKDALFKDGKGVSVAGNFNVDLTGLADTLHTLLFGEYLKTTFKNGVRALATPLKRYWLAELWLPLFDFLLNPLDGTTLESHRHVFESWLINNSRVKKLKDTISSIERDLISK